MKTTTHLRSQTLSLLSVPLEARMVSLWGDHWTCRDIIKFDFSLDFICNHRRKGADTWKISSLCDSNEWSFSLRFRKSHNATVCGRAIKAHLRSLNKAADLLSAHMCKTSKYWMQISLCQQNRWPEWTRCKGWRTNSWPLQCGHLLHD